MTPIRIYIPGDPVPKGRGRVMSSGKKKWVVTPAKTMLYELAVRDAAIAAMGETPALAGPLYVKIAFSLPRPVSVVRLWPFVKPDLDNLAKAVLDGLNGVAFGDDAQICAMDLVKRYHAESGVEVEIYPL